MSSSLYASWSWLGVKWYLLRIDSLKMSSCAHLWDCVVQRDSWFITITWSNCFKLFLGQSQCWEQWSMSWWSVWSTRKKAPNRLLNIYISRFRLSTILQRIMIIASKSLNLHWTVKYVPSLNKKSEPKSSRFFYHMPCIYFMWLESVSLFNLNKIILRDSSTQREIHERRIASMDISTTTEVNGSNTWTKSTTWTDEITIAGNDIGKRLI